MVVVGWRVRRRCALAVHYRAIVEIRCWVIPRTVDVQVSVGMDEGVEERDEVEAKLVKEED